MTIINVDLLPIPRNEDSLLPYLDNNFRRLQDALGPQLDATLTALITEIARRESNVSKIEWPCFLGENYPPTFSNAQSGYNEYEGSSTVKIGAAAGIGTNTSWPKVSRFYSSDFPILKVTRTLAMRSDGNNAGDAWRATFGKDNIGSVNRGVRLFRNGYNGDGLGVLHNWQFQTADNTAVQTTNLGFAPAVDGFHRWVFILTETYVSLEYDGTEIARHSTRYWPTIIADSPPMEPYIVSAPGAAGVPPIFDISYFSIERLAIV